MGIPLKDYDAMKARLDAGRKKPCAAPASKEPSIPEREIHDQIEAELKRRRFYYVHSRTDKKTTNQLGTPDFIIAAPSRLIHRGGGSDTELPCTYFIEVKTSKGKLTQEQVTTQHVLNALGHNYAVVRSFGEFLKVIQ